MILMFFVGWLWLFMISMQTRIVTYCNHYAVHFVWTCLTSVLWVYIVKNVSLDDAIIAAYIIGTGAGSVSATYLHRQFFTMDK